MEKLSQQQRHGLIVKFYSDHKFKDAGKPFTCKHFQAMGRKTFSVLARFEGRGETSRKKGSGRPAVKLTQAAQKRLIKAASDKKASQKVWCQ